MTINDKVKQILLERNFTPSYFADEIGVQRSSISHILSGRNRPSFDVIQKIIRRFPELGYEWIMEEETQTVGSAPTQKTSHLVNHPSESPRQVTIPTRSSQATIQNNQYSNSPSHTVNQATTKQPISESTPLLPVANDSLIRKAERIIVFYTDGSFQEYIPSN